MRMHVFSSIFVLFVCCLVELKAFPDGAPLSSCADMIPQHGSDPQTSTSPFQVVPASSQVVQGDNLSVTLRTVAGQTTSFKGYLVMAFDASKPNNTTPIGTFATPSDGQTLDCSNIIKSAVTHNTNTNRQSTVLIWTAPANFVGSVVFKTSFVQNTNVFWVQVASSAVSVTAARDLALNNYRVEQRA